ncbi:MAG: pentapeptide repeat-containing protein [Nocardioides sp.]
MELVADCSRCVGLCCVLLPFQRSADFAFDKAPGEPCRNLADDHRCRIHTSLLDEGMRGCVAYDCFGAGQTVTESDRVGDFHLVEQVHEIAWYLTEAGELPLLAEAERLSAAPTADGVADLRARAGPALRAVAEAGRAAYDGWRDLEGADLAGADLTGQDLRGACLRGAVLIGATMDGCDLTDADLLGADLRGASLAGADLSGARHVTRRQLGSVRVRPNEEGTPPRLRT